MAAGVVGVLALAGCASGDTGDTASDEPVTITWSVPADSASVYHEEVVAAFEEANPDIKVKVEPIGAGEYWTKIQTSVASGSGPDVFGMNGPSFPLYASNGLLAPIDDQDVDTSQYPQGLIDLYTYDGELYGLPNTMDSMAIFYNKRLFEEAGVPLPEEGWTWDDFNAAAEKLTDPAKGQYGVAAYPAGQMTFYNTIAAAGGEVISADGTTSGYGSDEAAEGVQLWVDLIANGYSPSVQQMTDTWPGDSFGSGKIAMMPDGSWGTGTYAQSAEGANIDIAPWPVGPDSNASVLHGGTAVVNADTEHPEAAKAFAVFASGEEGCRILAENAVGLPACAGAVDVWLASVPTMNGQVFVDAGENGVPYPVSKNTAAWNAFESDLIPQIFSGSISVEEGLNQLAEKMQAELDKE